MESWFKRRNAYDILMAKCEQDDEDCLKVKNINARDKKKLLQISESEEQIKFVVWLEKKGILFYHVPNGRGRSQKDGYLLKMEGVKPGVPDVCIPIASPDKKYHGLYIEMKRKNGGTLSDAQKFWQEQLTKNDYACYMCHGCEEAVKKVQEYLLIE